MKKMGPVSWIVIILLIIGGLNWGFVGLGYNVVDHVVGTGVVSQIIYILVGLAALVKLVKLFMKPKTDSAPTAM